MRGNGGASKAVNDGHNFLVKLHDIVLEDCADDGEDDRLQGRHDLLLILHHRQDRLDTVEDSHRRYRLVVRSFVGIDHLVVEGGEEEEEERYFENKEQQPQRKGET